jgi:hypothetical protein
MRRRVMGDPVRRLQVATREDYNDIWGPPVIMKEER